VTKLGHDYGIPINDVMSGYNRKLFVDLLFEMHCQLQSIGNYHHLIYDFLVIVTRTGFIFCFSFLSFHVFSKNERIWVPIDG